MEEFDLLPPGAQARNPTTPEAPANPWMTWLQAPENRAMLIGIGTNMMTGGWGGAGQQLGAALGAGAEARAGTVAAAQQQEALGRQEDFRERELTQRGSIAEADRAGRENVARIGADSRTQVAEIRGAYGLQRAAMAGARSGADQATYSRLFNSRAQELERNNLLLPPGQQRTSQMIMDEAATYADRAFSQFRQQAGAAGAVDPNASAPGVPAPAPTPGAPTPAPGGRTGAAGPPSLQTLMNNPTFRQAIATPEGRERIINERPDLRDQIQRLIESPMARRMMGR
jgi:hypothetical protein